jgi:transposase InsO family protein
VLGFSTQAFYKWRARPVSDRDWSDAHTTNVIVDVHADDPEFGYRFIADELEAVGERSCERRVWRLCREQRVWSTTTKQGRQHSAKTPGPAVHDDLVQRVFHAPAPDMVWLTDITEHPTLEGKLYCCSIKDVFSNRIVGYAFGPRMTADLAVRALRSRLRVVDPKARSWFTPTGAANFDHERSGPRSTRTGSPDRWDASQPLRTTPRWSRSTRCCRRTC